jgi:pimeloyl-ACP methyl ester carboxylesterase
MGNLEVDGAQLYYEIRGAGPLLLMIPGASGSTDAYNGVADFLAPHLTVVTYDRRGFSRSQLSGPQDDTQRLVIAANDAARLLKRSSRAPAMIFGSSSGAIVALEFLARHPSLVSHRECEVLV